MDFNWNYIFGDNLKFWKVRMVLCGGILAAINMKAADSRGKIYSFFQLSKVWDWDLFTDKMIITSLGVLTKTNAKDLLKNNSEIGIIKEESDEEYYLGLGEIKAKNFQNWHSDEVYDPRTRSKKENPMEKMIAKRTRPKTITKLVWNWWWRRRIQS